MSSASNHLLKNIGKHLGRLREGLPDEDPAPIAARRWQVLSLVLSVFTAVTLFAFLSYSQHLIQTHRESLTWRQLRHSLLEARVQLEDLERKSCTSANQLFIRPDLEAQQKLWAECWEQWERPWEDFQQKLAKMRPEEFALVQADMKTVATEVVLARAAGHQVFTTYAQDDLDAAKAHLARLEISSEKIQAALEHLKSQVVALLHQDRAEEAATLESQANLGRLLIFFVVVLALGIISSSYVGIRKYDAVSRENVAHLTELRGERQRVMQILQRAERLAVIVESSQDAIYSLNLDGMITTWNRRAETLYGYAGREMIGRADEVLIPQGRDDEARVQFTKAIQGEICEPYETVRRRQDGTLVSVVCSYSAIRDGTGILTGVSCSARDISELCRLRREQDRFFDLSPDVLSVVDFQDRFRSFNRVYTEKLGWTREEMFSQSYYALIHPDDAPAVALAVGKLLQGEAVHNLGTRMRRKSGGYVSLNWSAGADLDQGLIYAVGRDETELRAIREERERTLDLLQEVLDSATQIAIIAADRQGTIEVFNAGAERLLGYSAGEMIGKETPILFHDRAEVDLRAAELTRELGQPISGFETFVALCAEGGADSREWTYVTRNGQRKTVQLTVTARINARGECTGYLGIAEDVTVRKQTEAQLLQAKDAAEAANRAKSEFLANMSHEIRTPLNAIIGLTNLTLASPLNLEQRRALQTVEDSAQTLLLLLNDILDFSKIEAGRLELEHIPFDPRECVTEALRPLALQAHAKGLELACQLDRALPLRMLGDPVRWQQVLVNLVGNAIKFTPSGEVVVQARLEHPFPDRPVLALTVRDTGIGIPPELQKKIFEVFTQADGTTTRRFGGSGLGLSISRQLAQMMGGRIWVESESGQGSTFHFTVPCQAAPGLSLDGGRKTVDTEKFPDSRELNEAPIALSGRVLVVDDNATNRLILRGYLQQWGLEAVTVSDGQAALREIQRSHQAGEPFQIVLLDEQMPGPSGWDVARKIRDQTGGSQPHLVVLSSSGPSGPSETTRIALGVERCLQKPISSQDLLDLLRTLLASGQAPLPVSSPDQSPRNARTTAALARRATRPLRILLAEDTPANQLVARQVLEKWGHQVRLAQTGREAVDLFEREPFDLVLMDVQMPELDGCQAATEIRQFESASGRFTPIVALTAHALQGDREKCLAAGMDGYLSKPVDFEELFQLVEKLSAPAAPAASPVAAVSNAHVLEPEAQSEQNTVILVGPRPGSGSSVSSISGGFSMDPGPAPENSEFDEAAALARFDGDRSFLLELITLFLRDWPALRNDLRTAVNAGATEQVHRLAHKVKGQFGYLHVGPAYELTQQLEAAGREGRRDDMAQLWPLWEAAAERLTACFQAYRTAQTSQEFTP